MSIVRNASRQAAGGVPRLLHVFPTFAIGGAQTRFCDIANHLGGDFFHHIISLDGEAAAVRRLGSGVPFEMVVHPRRGGLSAIVSRLKHLRPDLLLTYNWGAMDWVITNALLGGCPNIHAEDGFNEDEAVKQKLRRVMARRFFLRNLHQVVVPSLCLKEIAQNSWWVPPHRLTYIPNGVDLTSATGGASAGSLLKDHVTIGTVASIRRVKNVGRLVRLFKRLPPGIKVRLAIVGDGPDLESVRKYAGGNPDILFHGYQRDTAGYIGSFDIFASTSDSEQMPIAVAEAMSMGKAVLSTDVGDIKNMVAEANRPFVVPVADEDRLLRALLELIGDPKLRSVVGRANQEKCAAEFDKRTMLARYELLFRAAIQQHASVG